MRQLLRKALSAILTHGKDVLLVMPDGTGRQVSHWDVVSETTDGYNLRRLDLRQPLGTYIEMAVPKRDDRILTVQTF